MVNTVENVDVFCVITGIFINVPALVYITRLTLVALNLALYNAQL